MKKVFSKDEIKDMLVSGDANYVEGYDDYVVTKTGYIVSLKTKILDKYMTLGRDNLINDYAIVALSKNGRSSKHKIHKIVAKAFVSNPNGYNEINHIDENKSNNNYTNLEWVDHVTNIRHESRTRRATESRKIPVAQILDGEIVAIHQSAVDAKKFGFDASGITACARGKLRQYKGYNWIYFSRDCIDYR